MAEVKMVKKLSEWQEILAGVQALMQESLPFKEAYWMARNVDRIESALKSLETVRRKKLEEMADKDEKGKPVMIAAPAGLQGMQYQLTENGLQFAKEWADVLEQPAEVKVFLVSVEKLGEKLEMIKPAALKGAIALFGDEDGTPAEGN